MDSQGRTYVADTQNNRVQIFNANGQFVASLGGNGPDGLSLNLPADVAVNADGRIYVSDVGNHRIAVFNADFTPRWPLSAIDLKTSPAITAQESQSTTTACM